MFPGQAECGVLKRQLQPQRWNLSLNISKKQGMISLVADPL